MLISAELLEPSSSMARDAKKIAIRQGKPLIDLTFNAEETLKQDFFPYDMAQVEVAHRVYDTRCISVRATPEAMMPDVFVSAFSSYSISYTDISFSQLFRL